MDKITLQEAALKLINDIAIIDTELAAKIKPSIDIFIESVDSNELNGLSNSFLTDLADYIALQDDKEAQKKWGKEHEAFVKKALELSSIISKKQKKSLNEGETVQKSQVTVNEDKQDKQVKEIENGETKTDIPIKGDEKSDEKKEEKKKEITQPAKEEKKEDKKADKKEDNKKEDKKPADEEEDERPVEPKDLKLPEDGFKGDKITQPLNVEGDDKKSMGKTEEDLPKPDETFPPTDPKVVDVTKDQFEEVKVPSLATINASQITKGSAKRFFEEAYRNSMSKVLLEKNLIVDALTADDKYTVFLNKVQSEFGSDDHEGVDKFVPIRKYATRLFREFPKDFNGDYDVAYAVAKEWYAYFGRRNREAKRIIPSSIFVELRKGGNGKFVVNAYLLKAGDLNEKDQQLASELFSKFTDNSATNKDWIKLPRKIGSSNVYMIALPFSKEVGVVLSRMKHEIVNYIRANYGEYYNPTTKIPSWVYSQPMESIKESINDLTDEQKIIFENIFKDLLNRFKEEWPAEKKIDIDDAFRYIYSCFGKAVMQFADENEISDEEYDNLLDVDMEDVQDLLFRFLENNNLNESKSFEFVEDDVDYNDEMQQVIGGLCEEYIDKWSMKKTTEEPVDFVLDRLNKEATLHAKLNDFDADEFINSFTIDELKKMIEVIMDKKWQEREDLRNAIDHDMEMRESVEVNEGVEYNRDEVDDLAREFIDDLLELGDSPWDMDDKEFIEWAWGWNSVPRNEIPYISKRWDIMRTVYRNNVYKK